MMMMPAHNRKLFNPEMKQRNHHSKRESSQKPVQPRSATEKNYKGKEYGQKESVPPKKCNRRAGAAKK